MTAHNQTVLQDIQKYFEDVYFDVKHFWISSTTLSSSITVITMILNFIILSPHIEITLCSQRCVYSQKVRTLRGAMSQIITKTWSKTHQFCLENCKNLKFLSISLYFSIIVTKRTPMCNFSCKNIGFISIMNEMGTILKP